jgi:hypothetical protein
MCVYKPLRGPQHAVRAPQVVEDPRSGLYGIGDGVEGFKNFEDEMQENRIRSTVNFVSKPPEASREDADASAGSRRRRAYTPHLPDPTDRYRNGRRSALKEVGITPSWRFNDPLRPRLVCRVSASFISATVHLTHPDADLSEDRYGGQHPHVERGVVVRSQQLEEPPVFVDILVVGKATSRSRQAIKFREFVGHVLEGRVVLAHDVDQHKAGAYPPARGAEVVIPLGEEEQAEGERIPVLQYPA